MSVALNVEREVPSAIAECDVQTLNLTALTEAVALDVKHPERPAPHRHLESPYNLYSHADETYV